MIDAEMYGASGVMKVFLFGPISRDVRSFGALPRPAWAAPGGLELVCAAGGVVPAPFRRRPGLTPAAAAAPAAESLVFVAIPGEECTPRRQGREGERQGRLRRVKGED